MGHGCISFDIRNGVEFDVTKRVVLDRIQGWCLGGCVAGIILETDCSTWSFARRGSPGSPGGPLRTAEHIYGFPGLSPIDASKVSAANATARATAKIIKLGTALSIPTLLENPCPSRLFDFPPIKKLVSLPSCSDNVLDMCGYGARWRKRTRVRGWNVVIPLPRAKICKGKCGVCSFTNKPHIELSGRMPGSSRLWTSVASTYPRKLAFDLASVLVKSAVSSQLAALNRFLG